MFVDAVTSDGTSMASGVSKNGVTGAADAVVGPTETPTQTVDRINELMRWLCQVRRLLRHGMVTPPVQLAGNRFEWEPG